jgi:hypothetical protein
VESQQCAGGAKLWPLLDIWRTLASTTYVDVIGLVTKAFGAARFVAATKSREHLNQLRRSELGL